jgi:CLIP-associating protein 1/2
LKDILVLGQRGSRRDIGNGSGESELKTFIEALSRGTADVDLLKRAALFCVSHPEIDPLSPLSASTSFNAMSAPFLSSIPAITMPKSSVWNDTKDFGRLFNGLRSFLTPDRVSCSFWLTKRLPLISYFLTQSEELLEYGLIVLWEMLEYQSSPMEGREADVFNILLNVRYCDKQSVSTRSLRLDFV